MSEARQLIENLFTVDLLHPRETWGTRKEDVSFYHQAVPSNIGRAVIRYAPMFSVITGVYNGIGSEGVTEWAYRVYNGTKNHIPPSVFMNATFIGGYEALMHGRSYRSRMCAIIGLNLIGGAVTILTHRVEGTERWIFAPAVNFLFLTSSENLHL